MTSPEIATLQHSIEQLRHAVAEVHRSFGDAPGVRRLTNDLERLEIDAGDLASSPPARPPGSPGVPEHVVVPDTPLDETMWSDADDEGVGGYHGERT